MEKKEDRRITMTKRMLKETLIEILKEKDIYRVTIRELCNRADLNRTTFYKYYGSQFELLADMENDFLNFLSGAVKNNAGDAVKIITAACEYLESNLELARLLINNNVDPAFPQKVASLEIIKETILTNLDDHRSETEFEYLYNYMTYGAYRVICLWLNKENREEPRQIAEILANTILN
ncbi:MAG: TetR/AcrR family transcriptional regulator C-terminal domain-containing protein [Firmicutes bacterium]|nr:TetR/AcrR family transcriptional regulator C-terminal domain-containing protein [Bacillota bacterium]